jgi:osmotically-inducible protein OsmY
MNRPLVSNPNVRSQKLDEQLLKRVTEVLRVSRYSSLCGISVIAHEGQVVLHGRVPTYYLKQLAQSATMSVHDVEAIKNNIEVCGISL